MAIRYTLDPSLSRFTVQVFATGMLSTFAHSPTIAIKKFTGAMEFVSEAFDAGSFEMTLNADSLEVTDQISQKDREEIERRMRSEVLQTQQYPEVKFSSTSIAAVKVAENWYRVILKGNLMLHGVTKPHTVDVQLRILDGTIRMGGEFVLLQSQYRIKPPTAVGGMIAAKDELKFVFDVVGQKDMS